MLVATEQQIVQLDLLITRLQSNLENLQRQTHDLAWLLQKADLEKEIRQRKTFLHYLLQGQPRPWHFHRLPPEMLLKIFEWITSPQDKLTMVQTFPALGPLMDWDQGNLYFQLIYPLVFPFACQMDWKTSWNLCRVNRSFRQVVVAQHEQLLSGDMYPNNQSSYCLLSRYIVHHGLQEENIEYITRQINRAWQGCPVWMNNMPFLFTLKFRWPFLADLENGPGGHVRRFLEANGQRIWGCAVMINLNEQTERECRQILFEILSQTPNLRYLQVSTNPWPWPNPIAGINLNPHNHVRFPELPHLRFLRVSEGPFTSNLIQQYGSTLKQLWTCGDPPTAQNGVKWSLLQSYQVHSPGLIRHVFSRPILESPLKSISLVLNSFLYTTHIPELLQTLSQFGDTLEKLKINYEPRMIWTDRGLLTSDKYWMLYVNLPKLWDLELNKYLGKLDWLVVLPSLKKLVLRQHLLGEEEDILLHPDLLHFPRTKEKRFCTNIWAYLRNLQSIFVQPDRNPEDGFWVTRSEHEVYHQNPEQSLQTVLTKMMSYFSFFQKSPN